MTIAAVAAVIVAVAFSPYVTFDGFIRQPDQNYDYIIGKNTYKKSILKRIPSKYFFEMFKYLVKYV